MDLTFWILLSIFILLGGLAVVALIKKDKKRKPNYYALFLSGIIWLCAGIPLDNYFLSVLGLFFIIIGLINNQKWKENHRGWRDLSKEERKVKMILIVVLGVLVLLGLVLFLL